MNSFILNRVGSGIKNQNQLSLQSPSLETDFDENKDNAIVDFIDT